MSLEKHEKLSELGLEQIRQIATVESPRVAELGNWPVWKKPHAVESIAGRIPQKGQDNAQGFDAGLACALDLIPRNRQRLSAELHGNYTPKAVYLILRELGHLEPDSETAWWLSASSICTEGGIDEPKFLKQLDDFEALGVSPVARLRAAKQEYRKMIQLFDIKKYNFPFGTQDGCIQGAYISGYPAGACYSAQDDLYFVGTFAPSLGLENFAWSSQVDAQNRPKSGPVHGSTQFVKCANEQEFKQVIEIVKKKLFKRT